MEANGWPGVVKWCWLNGKLADFNWDHDAGERATIPGALGKRASSNSGSGNPSHGGDLQVPPEDDQRSG